MQFIRIEIETEIEWDMESLYCTRLVEWPTWERDLYLLLSNEGNNQDGMNTRITYWNLLFSYYETETNDDYLYLSIFTPFYKGLIDFSKRLLN